MRLRWGIPQHLRGQQRIGGFGVRIKHCGKGRETTLYWFFCNTVKDIDFKVYAFAHCNLCDVTVIEFNLYSNTEKFARDWDRLKQKDHEPILRLIKMGLADFETTGSGRPKKQDWTTKPIVSDYTKAISSGNHELINRRHTEALTVF